jgi:GT2 family glycosyltransferase
MTNVTDLSICIVNHRTPQLLRACLASIAATVADLVVEVLVVNNTPDDDGAIAALQPEFPNVRWRQNDHSLGFAANQNQLMQQAHGRYLMPLNSDTVVTPTALRTLVEFMDQHPDVGLAGPRLVRPSGKLQASCRNFPNALTHFLEAAGLWQLLKNNRVVGRWDYLCSPHDTLAAVDWLTGACFIVRAVAAQRVGYFDSDLFPIMYGEDLEWCWRMKHAGWQVMFIPEATIVHLENQSPISDRAVRMYEGFYIFCAHYYSGFKRQSIRAATVLALLPRYCLARDSRQRAIYARLIALRVPPATQTRS